MFNRGYVAVKEAILSLDKAILLHKLTFYKFLKFFQNNAAFERSDTRWFLFFKDIHSIKSDFEFCGFILLKNLL